MSGRIPGKRLKPEPAAGNLERPVLPCGEDRRYFAFTLAECLVVLLIISLILPALFSPLKNTLYAYRLYRDRRIAESRIWTVCAILRPPVFYCALGLPVEAGLYKTAFGEKPRQPFSWDGPISVLPGPDDGLPGGLLRLAYAYPELCRTRSAGLVGKTASAVRFDAALNLDHFALDLFDKTGSVKNWVIFENSLPPRVPMTVLKASGAELELKNYLAEEVFVPRGERLLLFRALECWARDGKLYTKDFRTTGEQPRENGVCEIRFYLDGGGRALTVCIIVRGDDDTLAPGRIVGAEKCRGDILSRWQGRSPYILYCAEFTWPVMNNCEQ